MQPALQLITPDGVTSGTLTGLYLGFGACGCRPFHFSFGAGQAFLHFLLRVFLHRRTTRPEFPTFSFPTDEEKSWTLIQRTTR